jgi:DNA gyrase/topoisomerase IV subunit A
MFTECSAFIQESEAKQASLADLIERLQGELASSQKKEILYRGQIDQVQAELTAEERRKSNLWEVRALQMFP